MSPLETFAKQIIVNIKLIQACKEVINKNAMNKRIFLFPTQVPIQGQ
jgi:hypothetical protein